MKPNRLLEKLPPALRRPRVLLALGALLVVATILALSWPKSVESETAFHTVKRGDFTVSVVEGGTVGAVSEVSIRSEVEGTARIISIVPEGTYVKRGDLLVELDSSQAQDQVNQQLINVEKARFAVTNAEAQLEIQRSATNSDHLAAQLKLDLAIIAQKKYEEGQRLVNLLEAQNKILQASNQLSFNRETYSNSVTLKTKGYETSQTVEKDRLSVLGSEITLVVATNGLWLIEAFEDDRQRKQLDSDVKQAQQELERVINQNKRKMAQYEADLISQRNTLKLSDEKLERDRRNLTNTVIRAPQDGLVVYQVSENRFSSESLVEGGAVVRNRQELIKLPDLSRMKVTVKVHESHVNNVRPGLPAVVVLDSLPDVRFVGVVERVAPLPDTQARFGNPNLKVYNTEIFLTELDPGMVKPGVSAKAEIIITNIASALSVPIQAVTTHKGKQVVYLVEAGGARPVPVELGMFNTKFIQVTQGLKEGDRVLLSPPFDLQDKDPAGGVLAEEEKSKLAATNLVARPKPAAALPAPTNAVAAAATEPRGPGGNAPREGGNRRGGQPSAEQIKEFDKDGDGQLNEEERQAMREAMRARFAGGQGGPGGMPGFDREAMMKQYDKDGDGQLNEEEQQAMREAMRAQFGRNRGNRTNNPPATARPENPSPAP